MFLFGCGSTLRRDRISLVCRVLCAKVVGATSSKGSLVFRRERSTVISVSVGIYVRMLSASTSSKPCVQFRLFGSVLLWRRCETLSTSGFIDTDDVMVPIIDPFETCRYRCSDAAKASRAG